MSITNDNTNLLPCCPITTQYMEDPVTTPDGNTYERKAIEEWLLNHDTEPLTKKKLTRDQLIPNRALKDLYETIVGFQPIVPLAQIVNVAEPVIVEPISLNLEIKSKMMINHVLVTIISPKTSIESYHDIVLCIDVSGSMNAPADKQTNNEQTGLSVLDVLKYSSNVIINSCNEKQRIGIVKFSSEGVVVKPLTVINEANKRDLMASIEILSPEGSTNLYDGIIKSWSLFDSSQCNKKSIILFTDGEPNMDPPKGYIKQLQSIKKTKYNGKYISDINIYTYGNNVNSELSDDISKETNGVYGFIPDSMLMGDLLIHKIALIRSTKIKNAVLKIKFGDNIQNKFISESIDHQHISHDLLEINVGDILDESTRNFVFSVKTTDFELPKIYACLEYENTKIEQSIVSVNNDSLDIKYNSLRQKGITTITKIINYTNTKDNENADISFNEFTSQLKSSDSRIVNLNETFNDQVKLAYQIEHYTKWGKHYLFSLRRALELEQCNNFKDKCVQHFGGTMFERILNETCDIFTSLPPPRPSRIVYQSCRATGTSTPINMSSYDSRNNPCFHETSKVLMYNYTLKNANEIKKGDFVRLGNGRIGIIECVVKTILKHEIDMITLNNSLHITPYHPIKINNQWCFPKDLSYAKFSKLPCYEIFSFILEKDNNENTRGNGSGMIIGYHECATLGHGITGNIIEHPFFGTELVIDNLKQSNIYELGIVILQENSLLRDLETKLVKKIII